MDDNLAATKLELLHQKMISANVKYDPEDDNEFPLATILRVGSALWSRCRAW